VFERITGESGDGGEVSYVIENLVHESATIISGRPKVGKTIIAAGIAEAVASGADEFIGHKVQRHGDVVVLTTDPGEVRAWRNRISIKDPDSWPHGIYVGGWYPGAWPNVIASALRVEPVLFVLDNILGVQTGDIKDNAAGNAVLAQLGRIQDEGVAVLAVAHSSKRQFEDGTYAKGAMGSTIYTAWQRQGIHVEQSGAGTLTLTVSGNYMWQAEDVVDLAFDDGVAKLSLVESQARGDKRPRRIETRKKRLDLVDEIVGNPDLAHANSQAKVAAVLGTNRRAVQRAMDAAGGLQAFAYTEGVGWSRPGSLERVA